MDRFPYICGFQPRVSAGCWPGCRRSAGRATAVPDPGVPVHAYARVNANGSFDHALNIRFVDHSHGPGIYCIKVVGKFSNVVVSGTPLESTTVAEAGRYTDDVPAGRDACQAGSNAYVWISDWSIGGAHDYPLYVLFT